MNLKRIFVESKDVCKTVYFREGYTFTTSNLPIKDSCIIQKKNDTVLKAWGHSPAALLPLEGEQCMTQLVNARDGNPCDPFHKVKKTELFSDSSIRIMATDQHYKAINIASGTPLTVVQVVCLAISAALFLTGAIVFLVRELGERYG